MIEASSETVFDGEKEWYYGNKEKERLGPFNFPEVVISTISSQP